MFSICLLYELNYQCSIYLVTNHRDMKRYMSFISHEVFVIGSM